MAASFWCAVSENERSFKQWSGKSKTKKHEIDKAVNWLMNHNGDCPSFLCLMPSKAYHHLKFLADQKNYQNLKAVGSRLP